MWPVVAIFLVVLGGIYGGVFSPTEGAAIGVLLTLVAGSGARELTLAAWDSALPRHRPDHRRWSS